MKSILVLIILASVALAEAPLPADIRAALTPAQLALIDDRMNEIRRETAAQLKALTDEMAATKQKLESDVAVKLAVVEAAKAALESGDAKAKTDALAAIEEARKPEKDKRKAELDAKIAELQAERVKLDGPKVELKTKKK